MMLNNALEMVARTDPGMIRSHNEDAVFADAGLGVSILADGMGGYNAGEVLKSKFMIVEAVSLHYELH